MRGRLWVFNHYAGFPETVPASRTFELSRHLAGRGWDVTVVAAGFNHYTRRDDWEYGPSRRSEVDRDGVHWVFLKTHPYQKNGGGRILNLLSYARGASRWSKAQPQRPDVVIGTTVHPLAAEAARRIALRLDAVFCYEITDLWPETLVDLGAVRRRSPVYRFFSHLEKKGFESASGVIGLLPLIDRYAADTYAITLDRFCYAPNGVASSGMTPPAVRPVRGRVAWAGGFVAAHGLDDLLAAAALLESSHPGRFTFDLYGDGPERSRLETQAADLGLRSVRFRGWVDKSMIRDELATAELCVCTAKSMPVHRYGMSFNKLFDYFGASRPVVFAVDAGNNPVEAAGSGLTVPAGEPTELARGIVRLSDNGTERLLEMGRRGFDFVAQQHSFAVIGDRLDAFLQKVSGSEAQS